MTFTPQIDNPWIRELRYFKGVGPKRAELLKKLGLHNTADVLFFSPRRHEDRSCFQPLNNLEVGKMVSVCGIVKKTRMRYARVKIFEALIENETGMVNAVWFNQPYLNRIIVEGTRLVVSGKIELYKTLQLTAPEFEILTEEDETIHTGRIVPIYPLTDGISQKVMRKLVYFIVHDILEYVTDYFSSDFIKSNHYLELRAALSELHFPSTFEALNKAKKRLTFDDFFIFEAAMAKRKQKRQNEVTAFRLTEAVTQEAFVKKIAYKLTRSQAVVCKEIQVDLNKTYPMTRLLQGDVGSGKTLVAAFALWLTYQSQQQSIFLAPTEILAQQHAKSLEKLFKPFNITVKLLTSKTSQGDKKKILKELNDGKCDIVVGTHAVLEENVIFKKLGLVIIDEQHKFGVEQRASLLSRTPRPHLLVMTATPIPRTLALTLFGDLDISYLKDFPNGPKDIKTFWFLPKKEQEVHQFIKKQLEQGHQAFIVYPAVEESDKINVAAATKKYEELRKGEYADFNLGLVHGKLPQEQKMRAMTSFEKKKTHVLIATTVVEVGIDTPDTNVMVVMNAERFGLSQLHQLRGRVGRRGQQSYCFLIGNPRTEEGKKRLHVMTKTLDGFLIAEEDLNIRGPGDFLGIRQSGVLPFSIADLSKDQSILMQARKQAFDMLENEEHTRRFFSHTLVKNRMRLGEQVLD